ncbi:MAG: hypothetical protein SFT94_06850 [Pseudanabaenaceae cyanobacterium bins.68]|nr:hypothetical protein [Pseudanabaenaceae cyanobacterium bins.68]
MAKPFRLGKQTVEYFWQSVNWDNIEQASSDQPGLTSVSQYFAGIPWSNVGVSAPKVAIAPMAEKATLENFLDDISQFF